MRALVVGGGEVALRRARTLHESGAEVVCVAPEFCEGFCELSVRRAVRGFEPDDVPDCGIVVAATDDRRVNAAVAELARRQGCEVCVSDDPDAGTFYFPSVIRRGGMTAAVSSGGLSPSAAKYVRNRIEEAIPEGFEDVLEAMERARAAAKEMIPEQKKRAEVLRRVFDECLNARIQPDGQRLEEMIRAFGCAEVD